MMEVDESDDDRFVFTLTLPSLQEMASYQVALAIWYDYISRSKGNTPKRGILCYSDVIDMLELDVCYEKDTDKLLGCLRTPRIIEEMLKKCLEGVREETRAWIKSFTYDLFSSGLIDYGIRNFDPRCCVWLANGKIDYKRTAEKMLIARGLSEVQKFAIMCEYCLIDEITSFDIHRLPEVFVKEVNFSDDCLIYYWICYVKNELHKVPLDGFASTDAVMAVKCSESRWTAFEYFWNRLGTDDQISVARFWLSSSPCPNVYLRYPQERLLSMMSWHQQRTLLSLVPEQIILNFCTLNSPPSALWAWKHSKDLMNVAQFGEIVSTIAQNYTAFEDEMSLLLEVWDTAGDNLRNHVAQTMADEIISRFSCKCHLSPNAFKFLNKFLSMKDAEFRKQCMLKNAAQFGSHIIYPEMREVLDLCLPLADDQLEFKQLVMSSNMTKNSCVNLFNQGDFEKLNTIVEFYSADANAARGFKKQLLESRAILINLYVVEVDKWNQLSQFIDEIFPDNLSLALKTKQQFVSSFAKRPDWNRRQNLDDVIEVVEMVFSNDDELKTVKNVFLTSFQKVLTCREYWWHDARLGEEYFRRFIKWCSHGDEQVIVDFRNGLSVDVLFDKILFTLDKTCTLEGEGFDESLLADLDVYLRWCMNGDEEVKKYKLDRIMVVDDLDIFAFLLKRNDRASLEILFKWLFGEDEVAIQKFKLAKLEMLK